MILRLLKKHNRTSSREAGNKSANEYISSTSKGRDNLEKFENELGKFKKVLVWAKPYPFSADDIHNWENCVHNRLQKLDGVAEKLSKSLEEGLVHVKGFSTDEIQGLQKFLIGSGLCTVEKFDIVFRNVCIPLLSCIDKKIVQEPTSLLKNWKSLLTKMVFHIDTLVSLLKDAGKLWDLQCQLQKAGRETILKDLHEKIQNRGKCVEAKEKRIVLVIENCRQETNQKCLHDNIARLYRILDEVKSSYENAHDQENEILERYTASIDHELACLNTSTRTFLKMHEKSNEQEDDSAKTIHSMEIFNKIEELLLNIVLEKKRWYEDIERFLTKQSENIVRQDGQDWIHQIMNKLQVEHDEINETHSHRYKQIQSGVEFARLTEISRHESLFSTQREMIAVVSKNIENELEDTFAKEFQIFKDFSSHIKVLKENGLQNKSVLTVKDTINQVENCYAQCKESVRTLGVKFNRDIQEQICKMKENNHHFLKSLKQISDGGTFAESEVANMKSELKTLELDAEAQERKNCVLLRQKSKECCSEALKHVKMCLTDLQLHLEDLTFTKDITSIVEKTQTQLRNHVLALRCGGKLLREQTKEFIEKCFEKPCMSKLSQKWRFVLDTVSKRQECLSRNVCEKENNSDMENKSFLPFVYNLSKESLRKIKIIVEAFHQNTCVSSERVNTFMSDIESKYKLYQEQCVEVWINEVTELLESIQKLRSNHELCWNEIMLGIYESLSISLKDERDKLNDTLIALRKDYQQYQVETMAKAGPTQNHGNYYLFSTLCTEFEKASENLSQNIRNSVEVYTEKAQRYLKNFEDNVQEQTVFILETTDYLFGVELSENLLQRIERVLVCLNENHSLDLPVSEGFFHRTSNLETLINECQSKCSLSVLCAIKTLGATADKFSASCKAEDISKRWTPASVRDTAQNNVQEARALVHNKTCEVRHLYDQYQNMAEELRMNWRRTLENIQQFDTKRT